MLSVSHSWTNIVFLLALFTVSATVVHVEGAHFGFGRSRKLPSKKFVSSNIFSLGTWLESFFGPGPGYPKQISLVPTAAVTKQAELTADIMEDTSCLKLIGLIKKCYEDAGLLDRKIYADSITKGDNDYINILNYYVLSLTLNETEKIELATMESVQIQGRVNEIRDQVRVKEYENKYGVEIDIELELRKLSEQIRNRAGIKLTGVQ